MDGEAPSVDSLYISPFFDIREANLIGKFFGHVDSVSSCIQQGLERLSLIHI